MVRTIADLEINPNAPLAEGIIETKSRISNIGRIAQQRIDEVNTPAARRRQIKQLGVKKKLTD